MVLTALLCSLTTLILSVSAVAWCARASSVSASRCTALEKLVRELVTTPPSDAKLAALSADLAESFSTLEKLTTTVRRLSSRHGMEEMRARRSTQGPPPPGAGKAELRSYAMRTGQLPGLAAVPNNEE